MIKVYHRNNPDFTTHGKFPDDYKHVANVHQDKLEQAFEQTNTIDRNWWTNCYVEPLVKNTRSTSVGDIMVTQFKKIYVVEGSGYSLYKER